MLRTTVDKRYKSAYNRHMKLMVDILSTAQVIDKKVSAVLKGFGITHAQFNVLRILQGANDKPLSAIQVKERLVFTGSDVSRMIDRLVRIGLVDRSICPENRRKVDLRLTLSGEDLLSKALPEIDQATNGFYHDSIGAEEVEQLIDALAKLKEE